MSRARQSEAERSHPARPSIASTFAGYEVLGRLAVGGMAEVFLARERGEGGSTRLVVLKVIRAHLASRPELAELFLQEGRVALGLTHPNICHTLRFGTARGHPFLAMEHVPGVTLRDLYARARRVGRPLAPTVAAKIASTVAEALHSAHVARDAQGQPLGIVHQDVSPHNVMVAYDGTVKLLDFGVASTSAERAHEAIESSYVTVRGKATYLSPEQCSGIAVDARSDVFALGIVLYEMLTSQRLFARPSSLESMRAIASEPLPEWPASIPIALQRVLDRALAQERDDRYPTAAAMQEELEQYLADGRSAVTSAKIASELARLLGSDYGRAPTLDTTVREVAWQSSTAETVCAPIPLVNRRPRRRSATRTLGSLVGVIAIFATLAYVDGRVPREWDPVEQGPAWIAALPIALEDIDPRTRTPHESAPVEAIEATVLEAATTDAEVEAPIAETLATSLSEERVPTPHARVMPTITVVAHEAPPPAPRARHRRRTTARE